MKDEFFKFPTTPHLALLDGVVIRSDKVMSKSERNEFFHHEIIVEEKVDGANLGISIDQEGNIRSQNRGMYLNPPYSGQWKKLASWLYSKTDALFDHLSNKYIVFGEWCYAQHSVEYNQLPDWFLGFDIYDKSKNSFFSCLRRDDMFRKMGITSVPRIKQGCFSLSDLRLLISKSQVGEKNAEGLYLRIDQGDWLKQRAKIVYPAFIQSINEHWSRYGIKANRLKTSDY